MAKIVIDAREYTTGSGRYVYRMVEYLEKIDHDNNYVVLLKPADMDVYDFSNPRFSKMATSYKEFTFGEQLGFARQLYGLKADLVHFPFTQQPLLYLKPSVTTIQDLTTLRFMNPDKNPVIFKLKQQVLKLVVWFAAHKSRHVITISNFVKQDIVNYTHIKADKITVTYEAADPIPDMPEPVASVAGKRFLMYLGRPTPHKNLERLIQAFQLLRSQHPDLYLVLAGKLDANYRRIQQNVESEQIANIIFTDKISEGELRWLYQNCAAYTFPSLSEGFGLPALEAMQHGAPLVSTNATCSPEIYGEAAHYFDPLDVQSMADAINEVLTDKQLRQRLIQAGRAQAATYSWRRMAQQTLYVYQKILAS